MYLTFINILVAWFWSIKITGECLNDDGWLLIKRMYIATYILFLHKDSIIMDEQSFIGIPLAETWIRYARRHRHYYYLSSLLIP